MTDHFKVVCRSCDRIVAQCRCPDPAKKAIETLCPECEEKQAVSDD